MGVLHGVLLDVCRVVLPAVVVAVPLLRGHRLHVRERAGLLL